MLLNAQSWEVDVQGVSEESIEEKRNEQSP